MEYDVGAEAAFNQGRRTGLEGHNIVLQGTVEDGDTGKSWDEERKGHKCYTEDEGAIILGKDSRAGEWLAEDG